jgi:CHASE3 domain sensor protein
MTVSVDGRDYKTNQLALKVLTVEVDTLHPEQYRPAHAIQDNPFLWADWSLPFWLSVLMLVFLAIAYYLYVRLRDNKPVIASLRIVKRLLPHQKAMKAIEEIKADHIVTAEDPKEYYTRLTETLRRYIEERYGFSAMEMTSSEIIDRLMQTSDQAMLNELRQLFQTADLVKFAKYSTLINENDANLVSAIDFINQTKLETPPAEAVQKPQLTAEEQRSQKSRRVLQTSIAVLVGAGFAILCYVVVSLYQLLS